MARYYQFSKKIKHEQLLLIVHEIKELQDVKSAELNADEGCIKVDTMDGEFTDVMNDAVNIIRKEGNGAEISFIGFDYNNTVCWG